MRSIALSSLLPLLLLIAPTTAQNERPVDRKKHAEYASGAVMDRIMKNKQASWDRFAAEGYFLPGRYKSYNSFRACTDGFVKLNEVVANETVETSFRCNNLDLTGHLTHDDLGRAPDSLGSSAWGSVINGREFGVIAQTDGAAFVEIVGKGWWNWVPFLGKAEGTLDYLGRLPAQSIPSLWREVRSYKHYAIIGSEAVGHGVQIFDMRKLLDVRPSWNPLSRATKTFSTATDVSVFNDTVGLPVGRTHNVLSSAEQSQTIVAVGAQPRTGPCRSGLVFIDVSDINNPKQSGCAAQDGYVHDAQCLLYQGPDTKYVGREVCYGYNEDSLAIFDITDKKNPTLISNTSYVGASYTHQGWVLDTTNQKYLLLDDELDEAEGSGPAADGRPTTYIWDVSSLEAPKQTGLFKGPEAGIDHNQYVKNGFTYQSNYATGLRIWDVQSIWNDPTGAGVREVAFFDIFPDDDADPVADFAGTWGNYPFYPSGHILINTFDRGAFVVKRSKKVSGGVRATF